MSHNVAVRMRQSLRNCWAETGRLILAMAWRIRSAGSVVAGSGQAAESCTDTASAGPSVAVNELQGDVIGRSGGPVFDGQVQVPAVATQIEVGVAPAMQIRGASQRLSRSVLAGAFAHMMDQEHGSAVLALKFAQIAQQRGDFFGSL